MTIKYILLLLLGLSSFNIMAEEHDHDHQASKAKSSKAKTDEHGHGKEEDEHGHDKEEDEHGHGKEEDEHGHGGGKAVGVGKAILEVSEAKGFQLSPEAFATLEVKLGPAMGPELSIEKSQLVTYQNITGIYRFRDNFFKFIPVKILNTNNGRYRVSAPGITTGDSLVLSPVGLIRITDVYSTDTAEYGHGH